MLTKYHLFLKFISILSIYYGRTTIWKILVLLKKLFILFNALIGVYLVFKTTGFTFYNIRFNKNGSYLFRNL